MAVLAESQFRIKRGVDISIAMLGLIFGSPIFFVVLFGTLITMGRPIFFRQLRPGLNKRPFVLYKFRTMRISQCGDGTSLADHERLTRFGSHLRSTSLDEIPELWNVLRGDMSLVGPRPLLVDYLDHYTPQQERRHEMRPGITGWAQVNGRNAISWDEKFALDVWYVDNWSRRVDFKILLLTLAKVIRREGISGGGVQTMTRFDQQPGERS
jgi:lipopolysaccharide/colanic/teichoic acid biosynthesis glycosyltransferase